MDRKYKRLDGEERGVILAEHRRGASLLEIGGLLGRAPSTICRELRRGRPDGLFVLEGPRVAPKFSVSQHRLTGNVRSRRSFAITILAAAVP